MRLRPSPEPFTRAAERSAPLFAESDAYRRLKSALQGYLRGEITGRSFLVSGHRGAGKTTLVLQAVWDLRNPREPGELIPLLVRLQGPDLLPDPGAVPAVGAGGGEAAGGTVTPANPADGASDEEAAGETANPTDQGGAPAGEAEEAAPPGKRPPNLTERALRQITVAVYRAASQVFADALAARLESSSPGADDLPAEERAELASHFRLALDAAPSAEALRELYRLTGVLEGGVLPRPGRRVGQGMRELAALASSAAAFRMVSGTIVSSLKDTRSDEKERTRSFSVDAATKDLIEKALALVLGGAVGAAALASGGGGAVAALVGIGAALGGAGVFKLGGSRTRKRTLTAAYSFLPDHDASTLERELPVLIDRLAEAGLAPIFVVDELDKVDGLRERMREVVHRLKQFVSERSFFCFLTDRDYFEHLRDRTLREPYPREHTYFTDQLLVLFRPGDLHAYLDEVLETEAPRTDDPVDKELLRFLLLYRAKMHPVDLRRELRRLAGADDSIGLAGRPRPEKAGSDSPGVLVHGLGLRHAVMVQLAVEWLLARDPLRSRLEQDAHFAQTVYDALYYVSRMWESGGGGEGGVGGVLELSLASLLGHLAKRMNPNRWLADKPARTETTDERSVENLLSQRDRDLLLEQVNELVGLLLEPERLKQLLDADPLSYTSSAARDAIPSGEPLLRRLGDSRYWFNYDPYGRALAAPAAQPGAEPEVAEPGGEPRRVELAGEAERGAPPLRLLRKVAAPSSATTDHGGRGPGSSRKELEPAIAMLRELDRFVYDQVGMDLSTLASIHVLSAVPSWSQIQIALGRLEADLERGYPGIEQDVEAVSSFATELERRSHLLAASLVYGSALGRASSASYEIERRTLGVTVLARSLRFEDRRSQEALERELRRYAVTVGGPAALHEAWPSLERLSLGEWESWVREAIVSRSTAFDPNLVRLASEAAWRRWKERLEKKIVAGLVEIESTEDDLLCEVAEAPPASLLRLDLAQMTLGDWSAAFLHGCGFDPGWELLDPQAKDLLDPRSRAWLAAAALIELGLGERIDALLASSLSFEPRDAEEVRSWLRRVTRTRPKALEPRRGAVILSGSGERPVTAAWLPSPRYGAISLTWPNPRAEHHFEQALAIAFAGSSSKATWMIEALRGQVESALPEFFHQPEHVVFHLVSEEGDREGLPTAVAAMTVGLDRPKTLDSAIELAIAYLDRPR